MNFPQSLKNGSAGKPFSARLQYYGFDAYGASAKPAKSAAYSAIEQGSVGFARDACKAIAHWYLTRAAYRVEGPAQGDAW